MIEDFIICELHLQLSFFLFGRLVDCLGAQYGYKQKYIVTLTDDATDPHARPTRSNIVRQASDIPFPESNLIIHPLTASSNGRARS
jgi:hypothetical protein